MCKRMIKTHDRSAKKASIKEKRLKLFSKSDSKRNLVIFTIMIDLIFCHFN